MGRFISDDDEYEDYMNRKLLESLQYKPKEEEDIMAKYYDYEVDEEKPKDKTDWGGVIAGVIYYGAIIRLIICAIIKVVNGG